MIRKTIPSPALVVEEHRPIGECIDLMRRHNVGSILVMGTDKRLAGIFTERDLVRSFELTDKGGYWEKPVALVMSKPALTLELDQIDLAPSLMFKYGFRHVPIVISDDQNFQNIVGILSMRDLFKTYYLSSLNNETKEDDAPLVKEIIFPLMNAVSADTHLLRFLDIGIAKPTGFEFKQISSREIQTTTSPLLIIDLDSVPQGQWTRLLKNINNRKSSPYTVLVYNPALYDSLTHEILEKLQVSSKFDTFAKPISISSLMQKVTNLRKSLKN